MTRPLGYTTASGGSSSSDPTKLDKYTTQSKTASFTAAAGFVYLVDTTSGAVTATLPSANVAGQQVAVKWVAGTNALTVTRAGSDTIGSATVSANLALLNEIWELTSSGSGQWNLTGGNKTLSSLDARYEALYATVSNSTSFTVAASTLHLVDSTGGAVTATLPAANVAGRKVAIKLDAGTNPITVARSGSDTIGAAATSAQLTLNGEVWVLESSGSGQWNLISGNRTLTSLDGRYARVGVPLVSGLYVVPGGARATLQLAASVEYASPVYIVNAGTIIRLGIEVTVAGTAGTVIRVGIRDTAANQPGAVLGETTIAGDSISAGVESTVSVAIPGPGLYWFVAAAQNTGAQLPTLRSTTGTTGMGSGSLTLGGAFGATPNGGYITAATVTGALPGTYTIANRAGGLPLIAARA